MSLVCVQTHVWKYEQHNFVCVCYIHIHYNLRQTSDIILNLYIDNFFPTSLRDIIPLSDVLKMF